MFHSVSFKLLVGAVILVLWCDVSAQSLLPIYQQGSGELKLDYTVGGDTEDENYFLVRPSEIVVDSKGNLFVLDSPESCIKKFDSKGKHLITFGREGKGPGEILRSYQMAIDVEDNIVIYESGNRRFSYFDNSGKYIKSIPFSKIVWKFKIGPNGKNYVELHEWDREGKKGGTLVKILQYSSDFKSEIVVDSARIKDNTYISEPVRVNVIVPFSPRLLWEILPNGNVVIAYSKDYSIKIFSDKLELLNNFQHEGMKVKVTSEDKEFHFANITMTTDGQTERGAPDFIRAATKFPKYKPYFTDIKIDNEGYMLVKVNNPDRVIRHYDVFNRDGEFINKFKLPEFGFNSLFRAGAVYGIKRSDDEFPSVGRSLLE